MTVLRSETKRSTRKMADGRESTSIVGEKEERGIIASENYLCLQRYKWRGTLTEVKEQWQ